jgi:cell division transport system permease protein
MIFTTAKRMIRSGFVNFWRNGFLSFSSIVVLTLSLLVIASLMFFSALSDRYMTDIKNKVDVNVYFALSAKEADILTLKKTIESLPEVASVTYISREQALAEFNRRHEDNTRILQGLQEIGTNPLPAALNIRAKEPSQYESVARFFEGKNALSKDGTAFIESVNYNKNKVIIDRLGTIISVVEQVGFAISIILALVAIIISFNTIRITIYHARDEIKVMKLVGASNMFIRGPFVVSGMMAGFIAAVLTLVVLYPIAYYTSQVTAVFSSDVTLLSYYISNFVQVVVVVVGSGVVLGAVSSYLAVRRYLNV